jgi:hypothetical protein
MRPYFSSKFQDLEAILISSMADRSVLMDLQFELKHRRTPKAKKLLAQIESLLEKKPHHSAEIELPNLLSNEKAFKAEPHIPFPFLPSDKEQEDTKHEESVVDEAASFQPLPDEDSSSLSKGESTSFSDSQRPSVFSLIRPPGTTGLPEPFNKIYDEDFQLNIAKDADVIDKYIAAITSLIKDIKRSGKGQKRYELDNGVFLDSTSEGHLYSFLFTDDAQLFEEADITLEIPGRSVEGSIVSIDGSKLIVSLKTDLGSFLKKGVLVIDATALLEALKNRLEQVKSGQLQLNKVLADATIGLAVPPDLELDQKSIRTTPSSSLNKEQLEAVMKAVSFSLSRIWGPPGCGKTMVLSELIGIFYNQGSRILISSNTNKAVDQVLLKLCEGLESHHEALTNGSVLRIGTISDDYLQKTFGHLITLENIIERRTTELNLRKGQIQAYLSSLDASLQEKRATLTSFERCMALEKQVVELKEKIDQLEGALNRKYKELQNLDEGLEELSSEKNGKSQGFIKRLFPRSRADIEKDVKVLEETRASKLSVYEKEISRHSNEKTLYQTLFHELSGLSKSLLSFNFEDLKAELKKADEEKVPFLSELKEIEQKLIQAKNAAFSDARIIGVTCTKAYLLAKEIGKFDLVVIDEATMVLSPVLWLIASLSNTRVIVCGDPSQLPAIVPSNKKVLLDLLSKEVIKDGPDASLTKLHIQYRMDSKICDLISDEMYSEVRLTSHSSTSRINSKTRSFFSSSITIIDTSELWPFESTNPFFSRFNLLHSLLVRNFCWDLKRKGYFNTAIRKGLGVTTPYSAQAKITSKLLAAEDLIGPVSCGTVHRFQGDEYDAILVDIPESFGGSFGVGQLIQGQAPNTIGSKLLNVAVSRAKEHLVFLANLTYLDKKLPSLSLLRFILHKAQNTGCIIKGKDILSLRPIEKDLSGLIDVIPLDINAKTFGLFDQNTFDAGFFNDANNAKESIVVFSGFITPKRVSQLATLFKTKRSQNVKIRCITRPPKFNGTMDVSDSKSALDLLEHGLGCTVDLRNRIHQKVVIIDNNIVWHGSLNVLSSSNTSDESMTRVVNEDLAKALAVQMSKKRGSNESLASKVAEAENPRCGISECGCRTIYAEGKFGPYFYSETLGADNKPHWSSSLDNLNKPSLQPDDLKTDLPKNGEPCPKCAAQTLLRRGKFGFFYSCSKYPSCDGLIRITTKNKKAVKAKASEVTSS